MNASQPYVDLDTRMFHGEGVDIYFTKTEAKIVHFLLHRHVASNDDLWGELYGMRRSGGPSAKITQVFVCKIRKKLKGTPYRIGTIHGVGYRFHDTRKPVARYT